MGCRSIQKPSPTHCFITFLRLRSASLYLGIGSEYIVELLFGSTYGHGFGTIKTLVSREFGVECGPADRFQIRELHRRILE